MPASPHEPYEPLSTIGRRLLLDTGDGDPHTVAVDGEDGLATLAPFWTRATWSNRMFKRISWLGLPMLQLPEDILVLQELFWEVRPDVVVETGISGGGSVVFWSSLLALTGGRRVVSVDISVPDNVRTAIRKHPVGSFAHIIEGDAISQSVVREVRHQIRPADRVLVVLDSDHSRRHVQGELDAYADLVSPGSYIVVTDGVMQVLHEAPRGEPHWIHDNPLAAAEAWLPDHPEFERDLTRERLLATYLPGAWLRRVGEPRKSNTQAHVCAWGESTVDLHRERVELRSRLAHLEQSQDLARQEHDRIIEHLDAVYRSKTWRLGRALVAPAGRVARRLRGQPPPAPPRLPRPLGAAPLSALSDASRRRLDLLRRVLTDSIHGDPFRPYVPDRGSPAHDLWRGLRAAVPHDDVELVRRVGYDARKRAVGRDWPSRAETMVGLARLENVQACVETVHRDGVPGDLVETGVWRGGAAILMRAVLQELDDTSRVVWACDSFEGLPPPDPERYPAEEGDRHWKREELAVSLPQVKANFERYGLLDDQVRFAKGWFEDTLPYLPVEQIAVLRLDGDMYGSTITALNALEPRVQSGGFVVIDDYGAIAQCRQAVHDYRDKHGIDAEILQVDWTGARWRKP